MTVDSICSTGLQPDADTDERLFDKWFDPIESAVRDRVRSFIEELIEGELDAVLARPRYGRRPVPTAAPRGFSPKWRTSFCGLLNRLMSPIAATIPAATVGFTPVIVISLQIAGSRGHAVLGVARLGTDHDAQDRRLAHPRHKTHRSAH